MNFLGPVLIAACLGLYGATLIAVALYAGDTGRAAVDDRMVQNGLTVLRCRLWWVAPSRADFAWTELTYRVVAVDGQGRLLTGWAEVNGKFWQCEFAPKRVNVRWTHVRAVPRPVAPRPSEPGPLWDRWLDG